jgi:MOSC domain-containing protein YiiM
MERGDATRRLTDDTMKLISVNVGLPRDAIWHGRTVTTGIYKSPVQDQVTARTLNLDGDRQADLAVHGGEYKAVYVYPTEHFDYWKKRLPGRDLPPGVFGENFTTEGLLETAVHIGDRFAMGTAEFTITQPRLPCYKLGIRFESDDMVKKFLASRRVGFYFAVSKEGQVAAGDEIKLLFRDSEAVSVAAFVELYAAKNWTPADITKIRRLFELPSLPNDWKSHFDHRLRSAGLWHRHSYS